MSMPTVQRPAQTKVPTLSPTLRPTDTPIPNPTPTKTPIPSPTPLPDTQPGTILEVGQTWRQGGIELQLTETWLYPRGLNVQFRMRNLEAVDRAIRYSLDNFSATDNLGRRIPVGYNTCGGCFSFTQDCDPRTEILPALGSISFENECNGGWYQSDVFALPFDTGDTSITEIVISVSGISNIINARWRIPIYH